MAPDSTDADAGARAADAHEAIGRLADDLVPALSAALAASGLAEVELKEAGWRVRVRRSADAAAETIGPDGAPARRRSGDRASRSHSTERPRSHDAYDPSTNGTGPGVARGDEPTDRFRAIATSPAVGRFRPSPDVPAGMRVRSGDRLGSVDVLGVAQEVSAPVDGIVMATLVEPDDAVEFGQPLFELERMTGAAAGVSFGAASED
jgi:acetyl-CoA carboxylase biotin carboxyl carrier protein